MFGWYQSMGSRGLWPSTSVPGETALFTPVKQTEPAVLGLGPAKQVGDVSIGNGGNYYVEIQTLEVKEEDISMMIHAYCANCSSMLVGNTGAQMYIKKTV